MQQRQFNEASWFEMAVISMAFYLLWAVAYYVMVRSSSGPQDQGLKGTGWRLRRSPPQLAPPHVPKTISPLPTRSIWSSTPSSS
jgi:hypothetical protein